MAVNKYMAWSSFTASQPLEADARIIFSEFSPYGKGNIARLHDKVQL